jgi:tetratricopeptide (TPR) repeat protein
MQGDVTVSAKRGSAPALDAFSVADEIVTRVGPRAVTYLSSARQLEDGRTLPPRLSANDCYVALPEACRKMARVVVARRRRMGPPGATAALETLFPDPVAYLARAIRSVVCDVGRAERREPSCLSLDVPLGPGDDDSGLALADVVPEHRSERLPEESLLNAADRFEFRSALRKALRKVPANYLAALARDVRRERARKAGALIAPTTDSERQTLCRARAAVADVIRHECTADNPFVWMLGRQRAAKVPKKTQPTARWTDARQDALLRRLLDIGWAQRAASGPEGCVTEAVVNDVTEPGPVSPPSPEVRQAMRVLDLYTVDRKSPATERARSLYDEARNLRAAGQIEAALRRYRACYEVEPQFVEALNEVGVMYSQLGRLRDALRVYLGIIEMDHTGPHRYIAATNAADIHLTWFDAGRNKERNIEMARHYAEMAMERPSPMRACNLILALVKDRYYPEARQNLERVIREDSAECRAQKFLETLFQIRDADLVAWWTWLEASLGKE